MPSSRPLDPDQPAPADLLDRLAPPSPDRPRSRAAGAPLARPPASTPRIYAQDGKGMDAIVHAHYFGGPNDWWITEYDPDEDEAFGFVRVAGDDQNAELGYIALSQLDGLHYPVRLTGAVRAITRLPIEYDEHWSPVPLREALAAVGIVRPC